MVKLNHEALTKHFIPNFKKLKKISSNFITIPEMVFKMFTESWDILIFPQKPLLMIAAN
jgi:hypothetical protein